MALDITPVVEKAFTDEMLAKNFIALAEQSKVLEDWMYFIEGRLGSIDRQQLQLAKKLSHRKTRFAFGVVVGVAVSPIIWREAARLARKIEKGARDVEQEMQKKQDASTQMKKDAEAGQKYTDVVLGDKDSSQDTSDN